MQRRTFGWTLVLLLLSSSSCGGHDDGAALEDAQPRTSTRGTLRRWPEATKHLRVDFSDSAVSVALGDARPSGLDAFWSIASTKPRAGFFYADSIRGTAETRVAYAAAARRVEDIDASTLAFTSESVGPVPVGGIVVVEHARTRRYLAIVLDAIEPTDPRTAGAGPYAYADVTWYLTSEGSSRF